MKQVDFEKLAKGQLGLITEEQLRRAGLTPAAIRWALTDKRISRVHPGVHRVVGSAQSWEQDALALVLLHGRDAALSHATAASLWGISGFRRKPGDPVHVLTPRRQNLKLPRGVVRHFSTRPFDVERHGSLPLTTLARTLLDVSESLDDEALEIALDSAQYRRPFLEQDLEELMPMTRRKFLPGSQRIIDLLDLRAGLSTESPLETKVRRALRKSKLPPATLQHDIFDRGAFVIRADFAWPRYRVVLHVDGYTWHGKRKQFDRDAEQRSALSAIDWLSLFVTDKTFLTGEWMQRLDRTLALREPQQRLL